jgi:guanylate kinase
MLKYLSLFFTFILLQMQGGETKFLLLSGPSGAGKSTIIRELQRIDSRFIYIKPFTTRLLRDGEIDKISVPLEKILELQAENKLIALNHIYENYYATPLEPILESLDANLFPVIDWPIDKVENLKALLGDKVICMFLFLEEDELKERLQLDGRDSSGIRFSAGTKELELFLNGSFSHVIDYTIKNHQGDALRSAETIYEKYLKSLAL